MNRILQAGESAWAAKCGTREISYPCPVCFGKLSVVVILGNGEQISTPCDYCGKGYEGPRGVIREYEWVADVQRITISKVSTENDGEKTTARYEDYRHNLFTNDDLFDTREEADACCLVLIADHKEEERKRREFMKENSHKSFSWHVGYHRREAKKARQSLEWHEARSVACAALAKTPLPKEI